MTNLYGNYIGENIEVVITKKYTLLFTNNKSNNTEEAFLLHTDKFNCIAACITEANIWIEEGQADKISYIRGTDSNAVYSSNDKIKELQNIILFNVKQANDTYIFTLFDGREYAAVKHETYIDGDIIPKCEDATPENAAVCLQQWHLGVQENYIDGNIVGFQFNTLKHMYMFHIDDDFIYCRAARYTACNKGVIFAQNFRQNFHNYVGQSFVVEDNRIALKDLDIDENLFNPNQCVFSDYDIYWSVMKVEKEAIYLNGCGGETYIWRKPKPQM